MSSLCCQVARYSGAACKGKGKGKVTVKVNVKITLEQAANAQRGSRGTTVLFH